MVGEAGSQWLRLRRIVICATVLGMDTGNNQLEMLLRLVGPWHNDFCEDSEKAVALPVESAELLGMLGVNKPVATSDLISPIMGVESVNK
jgi:hypothetical protein